ncbi:MAG: hypothetical protein M1822_003078 [Bathelium mastoideum]|nr:MAG: hypothetical protein M1822_003078 [Bathelium mastoideum]
MDPETTSTTLPTQSSTPQKRRRRTTTQTSPHFPTQSPPKTTTTTPSPLKRLRSHHTPSKSPHFVPSPPPAKLPRPPAGTTTARFPPLTAARFGLIQEELAGNPFQLLLAVILLNQTSGRAAVPAFRRIVARFPTPRAIADPANFDELEALVRPLGLKRRAGVMAQLAARWEVEPPRRGRRWSLRGRNRDYPTKGAGKEVGAGEVLGDEEDEVEVLVKVVQGEGEEEKGTEERVEKRRDERTAALEIGHLAGCGAYAWDSWRIFCRDALRGKGMREWIPRSDGLGTEDGKEEDANRRVEVGKDGIGDGQVNFGFEEEWKRVLPKDKELRPFLGWMWMKEGWIWDPDTGYREKAKNDLMQRAQHESIDWVKEIEIWRDDLSRRQAMAGTSARPTEGKGEGPKHSYLELLSSSGSSDELSDVPSDVDIRDPT